MANCGSLLKSALVAIVLVAVIHSVSAAEKLASCCEKVNKQEITDPITGFMIQKPQFPCVAAVIFQTEKGLFCSPVKAPWVHRKIVEFRKAQATPSSVVPSSTVSLLSIITSTASPPSSSTPLSSSSSLPSFPATSEMPAGETFSEMDDE